MFSRSSLAYSSSSSACCSRKNAVEGPSFCPIAMANDPRMIGVQISPENPLGRFTEAAKKHKSTLDSKKPKTLDLVLNSKKPEGKTRSADEIKEAFHKTALRVVKLILKKENKPMDVVTARNVMLESFEDLLLAFDLKGECKITASTELPDAHKTWAQFTNTNPESTMKETEHFGTFYGRLNPKNPHAGSTPWELMNGSNVVGHSRNEQDAAHESKKLFEKTEAAVAVARKSQKAEGATAGA